MRARPNELIGPADPDAVPIRPVAERGLSEVIDQLDPIQRRWVETRRFAAAKGELLMLPGDDGRVEKVLVGLGQDDPAAPDIWGYAALPEQLPEGRYALEGLNGKALDHAALGWGLAHYVFDRYRDQPMPLRGLCVPEEAVRRQAIAALDGLFLVRDLVNTPANDMGPEQLAGAAEALCAETGGQFRAIVGSRLIEEGFPAIHVVGQASEQAPRLIDCQWGPEAAPKLTLVGKGVCFDTGGLDLKPAQAMRLMKKDMGGAAHVLGLARWIRALDLPVRLRVLIPAVENAVSGAAMRPGDVIATRKGLSVEVGNTDAEGRLVLADALVYACEDHPDLLLDFATLTGAARVALGPDLPALFTDEHDLAGHLANCAAEEGDPLWRLPLYSPYEEELASPVADLCNISESSFAGAITAALFLRRFVEPPVRWAHFDVYAWNMRPRPGRPKGGEAMGLRAVMAYLCQRFQR
ncbi:MAG: M17 family metallopeptidase [Rhodothalassiaceae bacterium]